MYEYENEKKLLFTDVGQRLFLRIRDAVQQKLKVAVAVRTQEAVSSCSGNSWTMLACMDRLVELGEIVEIPQEKVCGQHRVFISVR